MQAAPTIAQYKPRPKRIRASAYSRGYTRKWQHARLSYLRRHPLCVECLRHGRTTAASVVDHIEPHKGNQELFWDHNNWQALCAACHNAKTAREDGGFGNKRTVKGQ